MTGEFPQKRKPFSGARKAQLADKVYFKNGSCCFAQIKFYKKDSATEQRAPSGRELSSEARLKEPAGDYATIFDKDVAFDARGLLPPCLQGYTHLPEGGHITIAFVHFAKYNSKILLCHQPEILCGSFFVGNVR